mmetsp:Transcript_6107/g.18433  ORF Transcript_6107/g.18433 Transcript_6107/m.18433 type:complete len:85 (-) Transcript_6107:78-332(-)
MNGATLKRHVFVLCAILAFVMLVAVGHRPRRHWQLRHRTTVSEDVVASLDVAFYRRRLTEHLRGSAMSTEEAVVARLDAAFAHR